MSNFRLEDVQRWCPALIEISCREYKMPKCSTWFVLWFALAKFSPAIQQNIEYFIQKWHEFVNSVQNAEKYRYVFRHYRSRNF
jgi:hypothetical protein